MKKIFAIALALVMLVSVLPVLGVSAAETKVDLSGYTKTGDKVTVSGSSATWEDAPTGDMGQAEFVGVEKKGVFTEVKDEYINLNLTIEKMPVFKQINSGNSHVANGFFVACMRNYGGPASGQGDYLRFNIVRLDEAGNLSIGVAKDGTSDAFVNHVAPLGKKVGDTFKLTVRWCSDNKVEVYCDGELIVSYSDVAYYAGNSGRKNFMRIGYCSNQATTSEEMPIPLDVKIVLNSVSLGKAEAHTHTPEADDGDCTTAIKCSSCGEVMTPGASAHTPKAEKVGAVDATATVPGYTGDVVCSVCNTVITKGEVIPATGTPAESTPAESTPAESTPAESTPAESTPVATTPAATTPAATTPAATTPAATTPTNPETGNDGFNAMYIALLTVTLLAVVALLVPGIRSKLIRK